MYYGTIRRDHATGACNKDSQGWRNQMKWSAVGHNKTSVIGVTGNTKKVSCYVHRGPRTTYLSSPATGSTKRLAKPSQAKVVTCCA